MSSLRLFLSVLVLAVLALAQSDRGTLTGTVADSTGALIPNADVTAVNPATGVELKTQTTDTGNYTIPSVPAGVYNLVVQLTGFRRFEQQGIRVQVAQTSRVDVKMEVGSTTESITVTADAALLRTERHAQATIVGRAQLNELPLNFAIGAGAVRNPLSFVQLSPGYDSLQVKATKRHSHGLDFTAVKALVGDWTIGGILRYSGGFPIRVPQAQNAINSVWFRGGSNSNRVANQPLFLKDPNCHCFDPNKEFILNPNAWSDPLPGEWGTAASYYGDYRTARRPDEQLSFGRVFPIKERMSFSVRAEFFNVFNRVYLNNPDSTNALATPRVDANGQVISGFGRVNTASTFSPPRSEQIVARFQF